MRYHIISNHIFFPTSLVERNIVHYLTKKDSQNNSASPKIVEGLFKGEGSVHVTLS